MKENKITPNSINSLEKRIIFLKQQTGSTNIGDLLLTFTDWGPLE